MKDYLYIGDDLDNSVKTFDAKTGRFLGSFVAPGANDIHGPRGLIFDHAGNLLVTNQNVDQPFNGAILKYKGQTGAFLGEVVKHTSTDAPLAPRGILLSKNNVLYVADMGDFDSIHNEDVPGEVQVYKYGATVTPIGVLDHSGFTGQFHPRGMVFGPDGMLYVSVRDLPEGEAGSVLRFNPKTGKFLNVFIDNKSVNDLHRPEGLVFGPDGNLYITSFQKDANDTDKILIIDGKKGKLLDKIDLYDVGQPRAFAQTLLFGPDGKLFVPITGGGLETGSVRRYHLHHHCPKMFDVFVPPTVAGGPLRSPWYLTFGNTDPATLAYKRR